MSTASLLTEQPATPPATPTPEPPQTRRRSSLAGPVLAMVSGVAALAFATTLVLDRQGPAPAAAPSTAAGVTADPSAITLSARDVSVVTQVYGPGEDSGWHAHSGIHAVAVLSGTLTVYDGQCRPQTFEPGRPYVGGQDVHLVRNETAAPVEMAVTYLSPSTGGGSTQRLPAPTGCTPS